MGDGEHRSSVQEKGAESDESDVEKGPRGETSTLMRGDLGRRACRIRLEPQ